MSEIDQIDGGHADDLEAAAEFLPEPPPKPAGKSRPRPKPKADAKPKGKAAARPAAKAKPKGKAQAEPKVEAAQESEAPARPFDTHQASVILGMMALEVRANVVLALSGGDVSVNDLSSRVGLSQPAASHHLALLKAHRLVAPIRKGKQNFYKLTALGEKAVAAYRSLG